MVIIIQMHSLGIEHYLLIIAGFFALFPVVQLSRLYMKTKIKEYMLFSTVFLLSTLFTITIVLAQITNSLIFWILSYTFRNLTYFLFFTHTSRMVWANPSTLTVYFGVILYAIVQMLIFLWSPLVNEPGAGFISNQNIVIYSTSRRLLGNLFQLYVAILFLYGYLTVKLTEPSPKLKRSFQIMVGVALLLLISRLVRVLQNFGFPKTDIIEILGTFALLVGFALVAIVFYLNPGSIMMSKAQIAAIMVISEYGTPISSMKFEGSNIQGESTLLSGIITAIDTVMGSLDRSTTLKEIDAGGKSILVHHEDNLHFLIVTDTSPTAVLHSSLKYFARLFIQEKSVQIARFSKNGVMVLDIEDLITQSFPYTIGLKMEAWV